MEKQKTIAKECTIAGIGLHTGCYVTITLKPAKENSGIIFKRTDLESQPIIKVGPDSVCQEEILPRCTTIHNGDSYIHTVEHFMSALFSLGIVNLDVDINAEELPGLDGSAISFIEEIKKVGVLKQEALALCYEIKEPISVSLNGSSILIVPCDEFKVSYTLSYDHPVLNSQFFSSIINQEVFEKEIAPSRTFCLEMEAKELKANGLGKGANYSNTLVVGDSGVVENTLRFKDEFVRHKVLDFIGDLYLFGMPIKGEVFATKSGHTLNARLLKLVADQKKCYERKGVVVNPKIEGTEVKIEEIMKILPHRYPFLLVDRVYGVIKGKSATGVKNVTINDDFFRGHFPTKPIMPGVLMVEAMAQTAGVVVLTNEAHHGKVAFFMAVNNVKFRKVVTPGDQLIMEVNVIKDKSRSAQVVGVAKVDGEVVAQADMLFSFTDASYLD
jgi:UDP-3-O-[3-hydroxymyristoyl] N-acetylglucosamine deacetylase/3-hydroxyacyl-[acyl-carrier-protein] dehydratase